MTEFVWDHKSWLSIYIPNGLICWNDLYLWINGTPIFITHTVCYHNSFLLLMFYLTIYTTDKWLMRAYACLSCSLLTYLRSYTDAQHWKSIKTTRETSLKLRAFIGKSKMDAEYQLPLVYAVWDPTKIVKACCVLRKRKTKLCNLMFFSPLYLL